MSNYRPNPILMLNCLMGSLKYWEHPSPKNPAPAHSSSPNQVLAGVIDVEGPGHPSEPQTTQPYSKPNLSMTWLLLNPFLPGGLRVAEGPVYGLICIDLWLILLLQTAAVLGWVWFHWLIDWQETDGEMARKTAGLRLHDGYGYLAFYRLIWY